MSLLLWAASGSLWSDLFALPVPVVEKVLRPIIVYAFLVLGLRVFGKRELAQLNPFDLVVLLSLSNTVQNAIIGDDTSLIGGLVGALSLLSINYLVIRFLFKHRRLDQWLEGTPTELIAGGRLVTGNLARELLTESELFTILRRQGFTSISEVESCVLEPGGTFAVRGKEPRLAERHHRDVLERLDHLARQVDELKALLARR